MDERISALHGHYTPGRFGSPGEAGVVLWEVPGLSLHQIAAWPDTLALVGEKAARAAGVPRAPGPGAAGIVADDAPHSALLRVEPLKWWLLGGQPPQLQPDQGTTLDLSHSRTQLRITGPQAPALLSRHLPLDLRPASFPSGALASSALHHVGVTLWHSPQGYELFLPRGFALSLWEVLLESAAQFGAEVAKVVEHATIG